jgi:hypothetical protein
LLAALLAVGGFLPLAYLGSSAQPAFAYSDGRIVPWLLVSQAKSDGRLLVISAKGEKYESQLLPITGQHLEDVSTAYRFELARLSKGQKYSEAARLVGDMVSANGVDIAPLLSSTKIRYVLVPNDKTATVLELGSSLDSVPQLESAGVTEFGRLWRVKGQPELGFTKHSIWSITKGVQVAILGSFILLAIPSRSRRRSADDAEIFVEGDDSDV